MTRKEALLKAKIPCEETGIVVKRTLCDVCSPTYHCGIDAYVKDGVVIKIEGTKEHPLNKGLLCTKGLSNREYIYRADRIQTPLRRVGARGEGRFEPVSWEDAYAEIAERLSGIKAEHGAHSVAFFSGYTKWYRPWLQRLAHSFGSQSYGSESSTCFTSGVIAWKVATGSPARADMAHSNLFLGWACNPYHSGYLQAPKLEELKRRGGKVIIVDPRITIASERLADLHLRPKSGTDGALALSMANALIEWGWIDADYIRDHVYGFEAYRDYVRQFDAETTEQITGVPYQDVLAACEMIHNHGPMSIKESSAPLAHHANGMQNYRAIMSLLAITGNYDRRGGQIPASFSYIHQYAGFSTREEEFINDPRPIDAPLPVGGERFPLWNALEHEMQAVDLSRQILEGTPYPIKAVLAHGMNLRMFPDTGKMREALEALDFFVDTDLFLTDTAKYADLVLPGCSSFERGEFKSYPGGYAWYTNPVIEPLYESRDDVRIMTEIAEALDLPDPLLRSGYENCVRWMIQDLSITVEEFRASEVPLLVPERVPYQEREFSRRGMKTPSGKFELSSALIEANPAWGLDPLPTHKPPLNDVDPEVYPFTLCAGARIPGALHSRLHDVSWVRSLRPEATADLNDQDAKELEIAQGDAIELFTHKGMIRVKANPTSAVMRGMVHMYHGYREADVNSLIDAEHLDPYSGFPAYRSVRCGVRKG